MRLVGIALMLFAQRYDFRRLRGFAPTLVLASLGLLAAVLLVSPAVNGARRWISLGPASFQPSELAKLALAVWAALYLSRRPPPRSLGQLVRPIGVLSGAFALLLVGEPDLGTAIVLLVMLAAMLLVAGTPARVLGAALHDHHRASGSRRSGPSPYSRARFLAFLHPGGIRREAGSRSCRRCSGWDRAGSSGLGSEPGCRSSSTCPRRAPT